jgi:hypothetical protein
MDTISRKRSSEECSASQIFVTDNKERSSAIAKLPSLGRK